MPSAVIYDDLDPVDTIDTDVYAAAPVDEPAPAPASSGGGGGGGGKSRKGRGKGKSRELSTTAHVVAGAALGYVLGAFLGTSPLLGALAGAGGGWVYDKGRK